jgi:hypothetical protein
MIDGPEALCDPFRVIDAINADQQLALNSELPA